MNNSLELQQSCLYVQKCYGRRFPEDRKLFKPVIIQFPVRQNVNDNEREFLKPSFIETCTEKLNCFICYNTSYNRTGSYNLIGLLSLLLILAKRLKGNFHS